VVKILWPDGALADRTQGPAPQISETASKHRGRELGVDAAEGFFRAGDLAFPFGDLAFPFGDFFFPEAFFTTLFFADDFAAVFGAISASTDRTAACGSTPVSGRGVRAGARPSLRATQPSMLRWRSRAMARASVGTLFVMVEPAAMKAWGAISTGETRFALQPTKAWSPIVLRVFL